MSWLLILSICIFGYYARGQDDESAILQAAREAFNKINHGCYEFQYAQSCFCFTCSTQAMDIQVVNNEVQQVTFAEGNDFALNNFCGANEDAFSSVLESSSKTIDSLFDLIEDAINRSLPFSATYHDKIGIPLSIYIDRVPGAIDDEIAYYVNCIEFKKSKKCKANDKQIERIKRFNKKDDYSCKNIETPEQCPADRFECNRFYDGCNTCSCSGKDTIGCTRRVCEDYADERCFDCESNTQWDTCGNDCDSTCDDLCTPSSDCKHARCQCPDSLPIFDGTECVTVDECTPSPIIGQPFCVDNCREYTDGCMTCECDNNGIAVSCNNPSECEPGFITQATCNECQDEATMTYSTCGGCTRTCQQYLDNELFACLAMCQLKCECNEDTPLYLPDEGKCISIEECESTIGSSTTNTPVVGKRCPDKCDEYFDGCNDCQCGLNGMAICTLKFCPDPEQPRCDKCQDESMEWTTCGGCDVTCDDLNPICTLQCRTKCQCKRDTPIYDPVDKKCIRLDECADNLPKTTEEVPVLEYCPAHCVSYFDGCNNCQCENGELSACTLMFCPEPTQPTCQACEDDNTMEFTTCGGCDKTCDNLNPFCTLDCKVKCQCKSDTPIYDPVNKICIAEHECKSSNSEMKAMDVDMDLVSDNKGSNNVVLYLIVCAAVVVVLIIIFGLWWIFCNRKSRGGYQQIDSNKRVMSV